MKIDLSAVWVALLAVSPGLFALRARDLLVPRAFRTKGTSEELAEFVTLSLATHIVLGFTICLVVGFITLPLHLGFGYLLRCIDRGLASTWISSHAAEAALLGAAYLVTSFAVSHWLGVIYGAYSQKVKLTKRFLASKPLRHLGLAGELAEAAFIYDLLKSDVLSDGSVTSVFVEAELKNGAGFYSGQVYKLAIVRDEEAHRPVYLTQVFFKSTRDAHYIAISGDGILIDLADVVVLSVAKKTVSLHTDYMFEDGTEEAAAESMQETGSTKADVDTRS